MIAVKANRKNPVKRWFRKYSVVLFLCGVFAAGVVLGATIVGVLTLSVNAEQTVDDGTIREPEVSVIIEPVDEPVAEEPTPFYFDVPLSLDLQDYIRSLSANYEVPMELILAIIDVESSFEPDAVSGTDDHGLMQINSINFETLREELGVTDFYDPWENVLCGTHILSQQLKATNGDITKALMRYNNGATGARRMWEQGIYSTYHTDKVNAAYESYKKESRHDGATS